MTPQVKDEGIRKIFAERLTEAREACGLNMTELAERIGVSRSAVSQYEQGIKQPDSNTMSKIIEVLEQPLSYFTSERPVLNVKSGTIFFRSFRSKTKTSNKMGKQWLKWLAEISAYTEKNVNFPKVDLPNIEDISLVKNEYDFDDIEEISIRCRQAWGLGNGPIGNMVSLLQNKGFIVSLVDFSVSNVDSFSCWQDSRPCMCLSYNKGSAVRSRFDAAHELGHLIMHIGITEEQLEDNPVLERIEKEANQFASAFLMPASAFSKEIFSTRLSNFVELKKRWKVSIAAMIYRCQDLGIISDDQILNLRKQSAKWRKKEILDDVIPFEEPNLFKRAFDLMNNESVKISLDILSDLRLSIKTICNLCHISKDYFTPPDSDFPNLVLIKG